MHINNNLTFNSEYIIIFIKGGVMEIIKRVGKTIENPYGVEKVNEVQVKSPTVLCLGGDGVRDVRAANGFAKAVLTRLGVGETDLDYHANIDNFDVYSINYQGISIARDDGYMRNIFKSYLGLTPLKEGDYEKGNIIEQTVDEIYQKCFKSMIFDKNGKIYPPQKISDNFNNLTVVNYCAGSVIMLGLEQKIYDDLKENMPEAQCVEIMKHLCQISFSPIVPINKTRTSAVYLASAADYNVTGLNGRAVAESEEIENGKLNTLTQFANVKAYPNNTCVVACSQFGEDIEEHYSENYINETDVEEKARNLQMCFTRALATLHSRKDIADIQSLAADLEKMMSGDYENAKAQALSSLKEGVKTMTAEEWAEKKSLNKKYTSLARLLEDIKLSKEYPHKSERKLAQNYKQLRNLNSKYMGSVESALDTLRRANKDYEGDIKARKEEFVTKKFSSEGEMLDFYMSILTVEAQKWKTNASIISAVNELAEAAGILERGFLTPQEEKDATTQYPSLEKFYEGKRFVAQSSEKKLNDFIKANSEEKEHISE